MPTILIVDDSKLARIIAKRVVSALEPEWLHKEASDADAALSRLAAGGIDAVMIDFNMPEKNGLGLAEKIRSADPVVPIALVTANHQDDIVAGARRVSATFVQKPLTEDALRPFLSGAKLRMRAGR